MTINWHFGNWLCVGMYYRGGLWLRFLHLELRGFRCLNNRLNPPLFSERNGYVKTYSAFGWRFSTLGPLDFDSVSRPRLQLIQGGKA